MLTRRTLLTGVVAAAAAGAVGTITAGPDGVLRTLGLLHSRDRRVPSSGWKVAEHTLISSTMDRDVKWAMATPTAGATGVVVCLHGRRPPGTRRHRATNPGTDLAAGSTVRSVHDQKPSNTDCDSMSKQKVQPASSFDAQALGFSQGVLIDGVLYVSGQVSRAADLGAQVNEAWASVVEVVREAGGTADDIVKINVFTKDERTWSHLQPLVEAAMPPPYPASTMVTVVGLASPDFLVEIEAIAHLGRGTS